MAEPEHKASLLTIPPELREIIYKLIVHPDANRIDHGDDYASYHYTPALVLFQINRQIYLESRKVFHDLNTFIRIQTPWPEAPRHVQLEGHCPIVMSPGPHAETFTSHSLNVAIDPAQHAAGNWEVYSFVSWITVQLFRGRYAWTDCWAICRSFYWKTCPNSPVAGSTPTCRTQISTGTSV